MGFTTSVVAEALQVVAWADTSRFAALVEPSVWLARTGRHGPPKAPDFVGLTSSWEFVVLEAKGTQVSRDALTKQLGKGVSQKKNIRFKDPKLLSECLVAGLFVPQAHSKSTALLEIHDPEPPAHSTEITGPAARLASAVVQCEVGTLLPLVGLPRLGADVVSAPLDGSPRLTPGPEVEDLEALTIDDRGYRGMRREYPLPPRAMEHCGIDARRVEVVAAVRDATLNRLFGGSVHEACSTMSLELRNAAVKPVSVPLDLDPRSFLASHERGSFADHRPVWQRETPTGFLLRVEFHVD